MIAQALVIIGSSIFLLLGVLHGALALQDIQNPRTFTPLDDSLRQAMQESSIAIHPQANLWKAWLGFNLSHSLGLILFGSVFLFISLFYFPIFAQTLIVKSCSLIFATIYFVLSIQFWFSKPAIGSGIALACFVAAVGLTLFP